MVRGFFVILQVNDLSSLSIGREDGGEQQQEG